MRGRPPLPIPANHDSDIPPMPVQFQPLSSPTNANDQRIDAWRADARSEWERITNLLAAERILHDKDISALTIYCESWATYRHARQQIEQHGTVITVGGSPVKNPYCGIVDAEWRRIKDFHSAYGMTASSRARLDTQLMMDELEDEIGGR